MDLKLLGWNDTFAQALETLSQPSWVPARILSVDRSSYNLGGEFGEIIGKISGRYRYEAYDQSNLPAVGDWVAVTSTNKDDFAIIHELLPRLTCISRKAAGITTEAQIIAANIDTVFIVTGLDNNFNLRRIERYIAVIKNSGAQPVIILNKADLINNIDTINEIRQSIESIALDVPIHFISVLKNNGLSELLTYFINGITVSLVGSSGVGKSTLTNYFLGSEKQRIVETREDDSRGRHTTTRRQLFLLPSGGMLIDTPGMRELQLWVENGDIDLGFNDIDSLKLSCRFNDCTHNHEPGCAVQKAIAEGSINPKRLANFNKMKRELNYLERRQKETGWDTRLADKKHGKLRHSVLKQRKKEGYNPF
jgi:ribosome biogenesis GTPase / thiamine phosphate phosphatase